MTLQRLYKTCSIQSGIPSDLAIVEYIILCVRNGSRHMTSLAYFISKILSIQVIQGPWNIEHDMVFLFCVIMTGGNLWARHALCGYAILIHINIHWPYFMPHWYKILYTLYKILEQVTLAIWKVAYRICLCNS